jgi:hypothetical protein
MRSGFSMSETYQTISSIGRLEGGLESSFDSAEIVILGFGLASRVGRGGSAGGLSVGRAVRRGTREPASGQTSLATPGGEVDGLLPAVPDDRAAGGSARATTLPPRITAAPDPGAVERRPSPMVRRRSARWRGTGSSRTPPMPSALAPFRPDHVEQRQRLLVTRHLAMSGPAHRSAETAGRP